MRSSVKAGCGRARCCHLPRTGFADAGKWGPTPPCGSMFGPSVAGRSGVLLRCAGCHLLWPLLTSALLRLALLHDALRAAVELLSVRSLETGQRRLAPGRFGSSTARTGLLFPHHAAGTQISPGKNVNFRCASAAFTLPADPLGFAVMCQLAPQAGPSLCDFCPSPRTFALRLPSDHPSRDSPCLRLVVMMVAMLPFRFSHRGLPPHQFSPMPGAPISSSGRAARAA